MLSGGTVGRFCEPSRFETKKKEESGNTRVAPKGATPMFPTFPVFLVPQLNTIPVLGGLIVFCPKGTINTGYALLSPCYSLVT